MEGQYLRCHKNSQQGSKEETQYAETESCLYTCVTAAAFRNSNHRNPEYSNSNISIFAYAET